LKIVSLLRNLQGFVNVRGVKTALATLAIPFAPPRSTGQALRLIFTAKAAKLFRKVRQGNRQGREVVTLQPTLSG